MQRHDNRKLRIRTEVDHDNPKLGRKGILRAELRRIGSKTCDKFASVTKPESPGETLECINLCFQTRRMRTTHIRECVKGHLQFSQQLTSFRLSGVVDQMRRDLLVVLGVRVSPFLGRRFGVQSCGPRRVDRLRLMKKAFENRAASQFESTAWTFSSTNSIFGTATSRRFCAVGAPPHVT